MIEFDDSMGSIVSKGSQMKFYRDGIWTKFDRRNCHEGLAEDFVSELCLCFDDFPHVKYVSGTYTYKDNVYTGVSSYNMHNKPDVSFVSLQRLLNQCCISQSKDSDISKNIKNIVCRVENVTGLNLLGYLGRILMLDCLIVNEDRHTMNLGVCRCGDQWLEAPCFDNGSSLFCVNWTYRKHKSLEENIQAASSVAKPFSNSFDKQLEALLSLGCKPLMLNRNRVGNLIRQYNNPYYSDDMNMLIRMVLINRLKYYEGRAFIYV